MGREDLRQQADQSFKLDSEGEGNGILSNREEPGAGDVLGSREISVKYSKGIRNCSSENTDDKGPPYHCM